MKVFIGAESIPKQCLTISDVSNKGWLAIAKIKPLSYFMSVLLMLMKAFDNIEVEK